MTSSNKRNYMCMNSTDTSCSGPDPRGCTPPPRGVSIRPTAGGRHPTVAAGPLGGPDWPSLRPPQGSPLPSRAASPRRLVLRRRGGAASGPVYVPAAAWGALTPGVQPQCPPSPPPPTAPLPLIPFHLFSGAAERGFLDVLGVAARGAALPRPVVEGSQWRRWWWGTGRCCSEQVLVRRCTWPMRWRRRGGSRWRGRKRPLCWYWPPRCWWPSAGSAAFW